jgi:hypothetical protein
MKKAPLFRKVNTTAHRAPHRSKRLEFDMRRPIDASESGRQGMGKGGRRLRIFDYTPLFRFLLSKVGCTWNDVYSEAVSRLDRPAPIFWLVALRPEDEQGYVRVDESTFFSGLRVDESGKLQKVNPQLGPENFSPPCKCCTHTFNGMRFTQPFDPAKLDWPNA